MIALVVLLLVAATAAAAEPNAVLLRRCGSPAASVSRPSQDVTLIRLSNDTAVERLTGTAALAHLKNLQSRSPAAFAASRRSLNARGFKPTDQVFVERTIQPAKNRTSTVSPYLLTQNYSEQSSDGEIVYWSWTDGDDATWEGSIYVEIYSDGAASTWDGQIDASTEQYPWVWYEKTWERLGRDPIEIHSPQRSAPSHPFYLARTGPAAGGPYLLVGRFYRWATCHRANVVGGCAGAAVGCLFTGPGWAGCFGGACAGVQVASAITCYMQR